jgi:ribonuclease VapC
MIMVLDTSAIVAILQDESEADRLVSALIDAPVRRISSATLVETGIVIYARFGDAGEREVDLFIHRLRVDVLPVTADHANLARSAYRRFGKGQHPAGLNYGDCFSYALAMALQEPLLFKGGDFSQTDVLVASY